MFLMKVGGVVYVDGTKVRRTASMSEDITGVRKVLGQMVERSEVRLQFSESKMLGFFFGKRKYQLHNTTSAVGVFPAVL